MEKLKGYTFIELLISLIILSGFILMASSFSFLKSRNEADLLVKDIKSAIQYAKIQALILGYPLYLVPLNAANWSQGMKLQGGEATVLQQWVWNYPSWKINWSGVSSSKELIFSPTPLNAMSNGTFTLLNYKSKKAIAIILNKVGRIKIKQLRWQDS